MIPTEDGQTLDAEQSSHFCAPDFNVTCMHCTTRFPSRNQLHRHLAGCKGRHQSSADVSVYAFASFASETAAIYSDRKSRREPGYAFRLWRYATAPVALCDRSNMVLACLDTGCTMTLIDEDLARSIAATYGFTVEKTTPIPVSGIGSNHTSNVYVKLPIHFFGPYNTAVMEAEAHLVSDLKAKLLIGSDVMGTEGFVLDYDRA